MPQPAATTRPAGSNSRKCGSPASALDFSRRLSAGAVARSATRRRTFPLAEETRALASRAFAFVPREGGRTQNPHPCLRALERRNRSPAKRPALFRPNLNECRRRCSCSGGLACHAPNASSISCSLLTAYLKAHPGSRSQVQVRVARVTTRAATRVDIIGVAALVGATRSPSKARASRRTVVSVVVREKR
jgi:hypothetical protein